MPNQANVHLFRTSTETKKRVRIVGLTSHEDDPDRRNADDRQSDQSHQRRSVAAREKRQRILRKKNVLFTFRKSRGEISDEYFQTHGRKGNTSEREIILSYDRITLKEGQDLNLFIRIGLGTFSIGKVRQEGPYRRTF